ncbi:LOW QUALITY PROTEIN: hypothetical protein OSB04_011615 [Centaurea solstitialis]|uniref:Retroviral polymerase SH3-like domain-containing protein n=1 Tax=Centaurea solstitialis TaxID=347529 RepID=A0AA38WQ70_9ASTR|nr:LOW QUALITY PROTEIN: hypothetical protein OSB04_011615 [Centaurea solstitialis]
MSVQQPTPTQDNNYYMDTGASSHMTYNQGNLLSLKPCGNSKVIMVGDGALLLDLNTCRLLHRFDSLGDLYPVIQSSTPSVPSATDLVAMSPLVIVVWVIWGLLLLVFQSLNFICFSNTLLPTCHACQLGKHYHLSFSHSLTKTSNVFELVHSDLWTSPITSLSGYKYYILVLDDFSHFLWVFPLRVKSNVFQAFSTFRAYVVNQFKTDIQSFQCDNGKAERVIRTINNVMRTILFQASLPPNFWAEVLNMSVHILNLLPTTTLSFQLPCEILYGTFPTFTHLGVFGCLCYPNLSSTTPTNCRHALQPVYHRSHRCYDLVSRHIIISRHVVFDEDHFPYASFNESPSVSAYDDLVDDSSSPTLVSDVTPSQSSTLAASHTTLVTPTSLDTVLSTATTSIPSDASLNSDAPPATTTTDGDVSASAPSSALAVSVTTNNFWPSVSSTYPKTTQSRIGNLKPRQILNLSAVGSLSSIPTSTAQAGCDPN